MNKEHLSDILETCLGQVMNGQQTIDSVLAKYPNRADELRAELDAALWLQERRRLVEMRPGYLAASRQRLVAQISQPAPVKVKKTVKMPVLAWWNQTAFRLSFLALFLFVSVFSAWGGVYAVSTALPGDTLHQAKLAAEDIQLSLASDPAEQASLQIKFADTRAREIGTLLTLGRYEDLDQAFEGYRRNLAIAADLIPHLDVTTEHKIALMQELEHKVSEHNQTFSAVLTEATTAGLPTFVVSEISATVASNLEISTKMVILLNALGAEPLPLLSATSSPTGTLSLTPMTTSTSSPGETPEPDLLAEPGDTSVPVDSSDDTSDDVSTDDQDKDEDPADKDQGPPDRGEDPDDKDKGIGNDGRDEPPGKDKGKGND
jgi:hypothetical protein